MLQGPHHKDLNRQDQRQIGFAENSRQSARLVGLTVALAFAYFCAARLSLFLLTKPDGVAVFWPAAGVAAGLLIALGPRARWPVVAGTMAATIVANILGDRNVWSAAVFAVCNAGEAVLVASLITAYFGSHFALDKLGNVLGLLAATIIATAVSGIGGTVGYVLFHNSTAAALTIWRHWFTSDALGVVTVAPLLIGLTSTARHPPSRAESIEGAVALGVLTLLSSVIIFLPREPWATVVPIASLFPLLLWLAARCNPIFSAAAAFIVALTIVTTITFGIGVFGDQNFPIEERILSAQAGILAVSLCSLVLAALFAERREHEAVLMESEARLQEALAAGSVTAFDWDVLTGQSRRSANAAQLLGLDREQAFDAITFLERVHPDDRRRIKSLVRSIRPDNPSYVSTFRYRRPDGREMWLEETARAEFDHKGQLIRLRGLTIDISERKEAEAHREMLIAELDHRVKNLLARVAAVSMQTRAGANTMDQFVEALDGRIHSMAAAHSLLSQARWTGVGLTALVHNQLESYASGANATVNGPEIKLSVTATQALAMVLHELATNAAKYGALSTLDGQVSVSWEILDCNDVTPKLVMNWRERGGPMVDAPFRSGFGTSLIRELIPHELGGKVELTFGSGGVSCRIEIPLEGLSITPDGATGSPFAGTLHATPR